jgi:hypothetical protein
MIGIPWSSSRCQETTEGLLGFHGHAKKRALINQVLFVASGQDPLALAQQYGRPLKVPNSEARKGEAGSAGEIGRLGIRKPGNRKAVLAGPNSGELARPCRGKRGIGRIGWHTFRHSHSTLLHALGVDLKVQQELLRHADIRTTMNIYTQAVPTALREANSKVVRLVVPAQVA